MTNLSQKTVYNFSKNFTGYGHWKITLEIDNEKFDSSNEESEEEERIEIEHTTTNSIAIDRGDMRCLAEECLIKNGYNDEEFDLSDLSSGDIQE